MSRSTAILLTSYNRPELIELQLKALLEVEGANVFVSIDRDQQGNINSEIKDLSVGKYSSFAWVFQENKLGVGGHILFMVTRLLSEFDNCIVIEDDVKISKKVLISGMNLLSTKLPKDCLTIGFFGAMPYNLLTRILFGRNKWRKTEYFSAWGWGTQSEVWKKYSPFLDETKFDEELQRSSLWQKKGQESKVRWTRRFKVVADSPKFTWDFQMAYATYKEGCFHLLPTYRSVENLGLNDIRSTNTKTQRPRWIFGQAQGAEIGTGIDLDSFRQRILESLGKVTWAGDSDLFPQMNNMRRKVKSFLGFVARIKIKSNNVLRILFRFRKL